MAKYNSCSVDALKWGRAPLDNKFLNNHKQEFLQTWAEMLVPNFKIYVKAYLQNTYGFWYLTSGTNQNYTTIYVSAWDDWYKGNDVSIKSIFPEDVQSTLENSLTKGARFLGEGECLLDICGNLAVHGLF